MGERMSIITLSDRLSKFLMVAAATWTFGLAFLVMADIVGRTVFNAPVYGTAEMVAASIVIIVFLQAGYAIRSRSMLKADFLVVLLPSGRLSRASLKAKAPCAFLHGRRVGR